MLPVLLLHGALGAGLQLQDLRRELPSGTDVHIVEFSAHGQTPARARFGIESFAEEVLAYLDDHNIATIDIFGYSMGGYVALYLAKHYPARVGRIVTLGTKLRWDPETAAKEVASLNPEKILQKVPQFAATLNERHRALPWTELMGKTAQMMMDLGNNPALSEDDFRSINSYVRLLIGDRDKMVSLEETLNVFKLLQKGEMGMLPGTSHPIEGADISLLASHITSFFTKSSH